jgi:hypothetical protein
LRSPFGGADSKLVWPIDRSWSELHATRLATTATEMERRIAEQYRRIPL